ncbi:hypothetical protein ACPOL_6797 (plasmid) [Acidisarcina polymorpha]|uniref:Uncharacterized protein n=1 Tax=Acidisarcina polymorpha TaxID=2211140 RepID=A0A2Z5GAV9_9BACT|nr:hypothetical protein ACPOL_6797 [Acidisarcina polymorpha]
MFAGAAAWLLASRSGDPSKMVSAKEAAAKLQQGLGGLSHHGLSS